VTYVYDDVTYVYDDVTYGPELTHRVTHSRSHTSVAKSATTISPTNSHHASIRQGAILASDSQSPSPRTQTVVGHLQRDKGEAGALAADVDAETAAAAAAAVEAEEEEEEEEEEEVEEEVEEEEEILESRRRGWHQKGCSAV